MLSSSPNCSSSQQLRIRLSYEAGWVRMASLPLVAWLASWFFSTAVWHTLGCGCGRALHRRAHNMPMVPNVYSCYQLGLHGRHRKRRAQISPLKPPSSSATLEVPTPENWCTKHCPHHRHHRELLHGQEGQALFRRHIWPTRTPSPSSNDQRKADDAASSHQGDGNCNGRDCAD